MWWFLVLLGLLIALAGLAVIVLGISIFVSTFGNTLITTGAVAASGGFVIMAMGLVLRQLERFSQRLEATIDRASMAQPAPSSRAAAPLERVVSEPAGFSEPAMEDEEEEDARSHSPAPEDRGFPPLVRHQLPPELRPLSPAPDLVSRSESPAHEAHSPDKRPTRVLELPPLRRSAEAETDAAPQTPETDEEGPYILKSGIVAGMAYTLYSDGSIQAELPDGIVRFDSLNELRDHVAKAQER